jgi:hypothetical protein
MVKAYGGGMIHSWSTTDADGMAADALKLVKKWARYRGESGFDKWFCAPTRT